jgi:acyl carrier protein
VVIISGLLTLLVLSGATLAVAFRNGWVTVAPNAAPVAANSPVSVAPAVVAAEYVAPDGDLQARIVEVWKDVLKLPRVGTRDNFFDLGGHSLLAVQAHRRLREALQRELSITDIFRFPTVQSLAAYLSGDSAGGAQQGAERAPGRRAAMQRRQQLRAGAKV